MRDRVMRDVQMGLPKVALLSREVMMRDACRNKPSTGNEGRMTREERPECCTHCEPAVPTKDNNSEGSMEAPLQQPSNRVPD